MNLESSRSVPTSIRTRRTVRNLAIALIATIPLAACSSGASDDARSDDVAEPIGPTTTAGDDVDPGPAATLPPESSASVTVAPPPAPDSQEAIGLAQRFVEARDAWDGEAVRALVADDAVIDDFAVSSPDDYIADAELDRAIGWRYMQPECTAIVPGPPIQVSCTYTMQNAWSEALGVGPFTGSNLRFVIANGQIQQVTHIFDVSEFDPEVWAIFQEWLSATHPGDVGVMFDTNSGDFSLTPEAIALFEQHTTEFVASLNNSGSD